MGLGHRGGGRRAPDRGVGHGCGAAPGHRPPGRDGPRPVPNVRLTGNVAVDELVLGAMAGSQPPPDPDQLARAAEELAETVSLAAAGDGWPNPAPTIGPRRRSTTPRSPAARLGGYGTATSWSPSTAASARDLRSPAPDGGRRLGLTGRPGGRAAPPWSTPTVAGLHPRVRHGNSPGRLPGLPRGPPPSPAGRQPGATRAAPPRRPATAVVADDAVLRSQPVDPDPGPGRLGREAGDQLDPVSGRRAGRPVRRVPRGLHGRAGRRARAGRCGDRRGPGGGHPRPVRPPLAPVPGAARPAPPDCWGRPPTRRSGWCRPWPSSRRSRWTAAACTPASVTGSCPPARPCRCGSTGVGHRCGGTPAATSASCGRDRSTTSWPIGWLGWVRSPSPEFDALVA